MLTCHVDGSRASWVLPDKSSRRPSYQVARDSEERRAPRAEGVRLPKIELRSGVVGAAGEEASSEVAVVESLQPSVGRIGAPPKKKNIDLEVARAAMSKEIGEGEGEGSREVDRKSYRTRGSIHAAIHSVRLCTLRKMVGNHAGVGDPS
jgi:hypothetical protein